MARDRFQAGWSEEFGSTARSLQCHRFRWSRSVSFDRIRRASFERWQEQCESTGRCPNRRHVNGVKEWFISSEAMHEFLQTVEAEVQSRPTPIEFEMAYQARIAIDRIRFAIK